MKSPRESHYQKFLAQCSDSIYTIFYGVQGFISFSVGKIEIIQIEIAQLFDTFWLEGWFLCI